MVRLFRRASWALLALVALAVPLVASAQDRGPSDCELLTAGNDYYTLYAWDHAPNGADRGSACNVGAYGVVTGPLHPAGAGQDLLQDGASPDTSFNTVLSYSTATAYPLSNGSTLAPAARVPTAVIPLAQFGNAEAVDAQTLRITFDTVDQKSANDDLIIIVEIQVFGTTLADSKVRVQTEVENPLDNEVAERGKQTSVTVVIRHLWDFALDGLGGVQENGPYFLHYPTLTPYGDETSFSGSGLPTIYEMGASPEIATYWALGSGTDLLPFAESADRGAAVAVPPTRLDYVCAPLAAAAVFDYTTTGQTVSSEDTDCSPDPTGDSGVAYYWLQEQTDASRGSGIVIEPGESYTVDSWLWSDGFPPPPAPVLCLTLELDATQAANQQLGINNLQNNDVVCSDDALEPVLTGARGEGDGTFEMFFDGSDVGITRTIIDGMDILQPPFFFKPTVERGPEEEPMDILLSFNIAHSIPPIGLVLQADIIRFVAEENGPQTAGAFKRFFDGSDIGLQSAGEDIDAFVFQENPFFDQMASRGMEVTLGDLFFSTKGNMRIPGLTARDEDIVVCWGYNFTLLPGGDIESTCEEIELFFDGSAAGLDADSEDVDAFSFGADIRRGQAPDLYLSTRGRFEIEGVSGRNEDVFRCSAGFQDPVARGGPLPFDYCVDVFIEFNGSDYGLGSNDVFSIDLLRPECILQGVRGHCPE